MSDVCLVLEGTYPYVRGGVSTCVHDIITNMPDLKFSILSIMPTPADTRTERYEIPSNVQSIINVHIRDFRFSPHLIRKRNRQIFELFKLFEQGIEEGSKGKLEEFFVKTLKEKEDIDLHYAFSSPDFWKAVQEGYNIGDPTISFLDYFWNYRFTFLPLLQIIKANIPPAPIYHALSTGYAGVLATLSKIKFNSNMILTEHGIYTKERRIEIAQASWIYERELQFTKATPELGYFRNWWIKYFGTMSKLTYFYADKITTLYEGNKRSQVLDGADPKNISIIPNGMEIALYDKISKSRQKKQRRRTIAFIGRIVPIKDVKTFIKACKIIVNKLPDAKILLIGPEEEESGYYRECLVLIKMLGLEGNIVFTGHVDTKDYYPEIDLIVLTSISEAQPLVILEANACGIPAVATDVGSCRELLEGGSEEDRLLGASGIVTEFYSPEQTAAAVIQILEDEKLYESMAEAARKRVQKYYNQQDMINSYRNLYEQFI